MLVAGSIVAPALPLRLVHRSVWRPHLRATAAGGGGGGNEDGEEAAVAAERLPPMVVTYRLAGVDGEATEEVRRLASRATHHSMSLDVHEHNTHS